MSRRAADAKSEASRRALHDWYSSTALKRLQPARNAVVAIQTRWHPDDFAGRRLAEEGRIEEGGRWKVIHLPAIADPKFGPDPLGGAPGDPLPHPKIPTRQEAAGGLVGGHETHLDPPGLARPGAGRPAAG